MYESTIILVLAALCVFLLGCLLVTGQQLKEQRVLTDKLHEKERTNFDIKVNLLNAIRQADKRESILKKQVTLLSSNLPRRKRSEDKKTEGEGTEEHY